MASLEEVKKFLKKSVDWLKDEDMGCTTLKLDDRLAICVGWLPGYGEEKRDDCIQSREEPDFAINAGIKVWTSDDMRTDYEFINMPYYKDGEVVETDISVEPSDEEDNYEHLAKWLLDSYEGMSDLEMDEKGLIIEEEPHEEETIEVEEESLEESKTECVKKELVARGLDKADDLSSEDAIDIAKKCGCEQSEVVDVWKHAKPIEEAQEKIVYVWKKLGDGGDDWFLVKRGEKDIENNHVLCLSRMNRYFPWSVYVKDEERKDLSSKLPSDNLKDNKEYILAHIDEFVEMPKEESCEKGECKKSLKETWDGDSVIEDLADRAKGYMDDGYDVDEAVQSAIDDGLIYTSDIMTLLDHYGSIDDSTIIESYYDDLYSDVYSQVEDYEPEVEDEDDFEDEESEEEE